MLRIKDKKDVNDAFYHLERSKEITQVFVDMKDAKRRRPYS